MVLPPPDDSVENAARKKKKRSDRFLFCSLRQMIVRVIQLHGAAKPMLCMRNPESVADVIRLFVSADHLRFARPSVRSCYKSTHNPRLT